MPLTLNLADPLPRPADRLPRRSRRQAFAFLGSLPPRRAYERPHVPSQLYGAERQWYVASLPPRPHLTLFPGDFIGGDLHWAAGISLVTPLPKRPEWPLKPHFFVNAGRLASVDPSASLSGPSPRCH